LPVLPRSGAFELDIVFEIPCDEMLWQTLHLLAMKTALPSLEAPVGGVEVVGGGVVGGGVDGGGVVGGGVEVGGVVGVVDVVGAGFVGVVPVPLVVAGAGFVAGVPGLVVVEEPPVVASGVALDAAGVVDSAVVTVVVAVSTRAVVSIAAGGVTSAVVSVDTALVSAPGSTFTSASQEESMTAAAATTSDTNVDLMESPVVDEWTGARERAVETARLPHDPTCVDPTVTHMTAVMFACAAARAC
jgi:hypothetical protein